MKETERPSRVELTTLLERGYRYALSLTHERSRAEDLVQDAWTVLLGRGGPFHVGYLFATIRNRFVDLTRRDRVFSPELLEGLEDGADAPAARDEEAILLDGAALRQGLSRLRVEERESLYLFAVEGYALGEIARLTGRPEGTISSLVTRARQKLRRALAAGGLRAAK